MHRHEKDQKGEKNYGASMKVLQKIIPEFWPVMAGVLGGDEDHRVTTKGVTLEKNYSY
jgi:hypothetical protein